MSTHVYVEGGGSSQKLITALRRAYRRFFERAEFIGNMPTIVAGGSRHRTVEMFVTALKHNPSRRNVLLVDSERRVDSEDCPAVLLSEDFPNWSKHFHNNSDDCQLMVVCMEAWLTADPEELAEYFGKGFTNKLPALNDIENTEKDRLFQAIDRSTRSSNRGAYQKGRDSFAILERVDPTKLIRLCWCGRFVQSMRS